MKGSSLATVTTPSASARLRLCEGKLRDVGRGELLIARGSVLGRAGFELIFKRGGGGAGAAMSDCCAETDTDCGGIEERRGIGPDKDAEAVNNRGICDAEG